MTSQINTWRSADGACEGLPQALTDLAVKLQHLLARQPQISLRTFYKRLVVSFLMKVVCGGMEECVSCVLKNVRLLVRVFW